MPEKFHNTDASPKSTRRYDERFPDANPGFRADDEIMKAFGDFDCDICGRPTEWLHAKFAVYLCSQDCLSRYRSKHQRL